MKTMINVSLTDGGLPCLEFTIGESSSTIEGKLLAHFATRAELEGIHIRQIKTWNDENDCMYTTLQIRTGEHNDLDQRAIE